MNPSICFLIFLFLSRELVSYTYNYDRYTLFRGTPKTERQLGFFQNLSVRYYVNYWTFPGRVNKPVDFVISPRDREQVVSEAFSSGIELTPVIENIQEAFDNQTVSSYTRRRTETFDWTAFFKINDIYGWLDDMAEKYPSEMNVTSIGKTHEGRNIVAVDIALRKDIMKRPRPKVVIEGGIHAREWIAPAFVTYLINEIMNAQNSTNPTWRAIAHHYEWHIVPVLNPDGYAFSHEKVTIGSSKIPYKEIFCGTHAFSEPESRAMADYVKLHSKDLMYYIGFHSYGQLMIVPYANSKLRQDNYDKMVRMARIAALKIERRYNTQYKCGNAYETVGYFSSGVSACWVKKTFCVPYVIVFELRDQGKYGFALPKTQILPTCKETMDGLTYLLSVEKKTLSEREKKRLMEMESSGNKNTKYLYCFILYCFVSLCLI